MSTSLENAEVEGDLDMSGKKHSSVKLTASLSETQSLPRRKHIYLCSEIENIPWGLSFTIQAPMAEVDSSIKVWLMSHWLPL